MARRRHHTGSVAKIFKLIKCERGIAAKINCSRESGYVFYTFYLRSSVEYIHF
jgi:hypothetical protein